MLERTLRGLGWLFVAVSVFVLVAPHAIAWGTGHRLLIVDGGSMVPTMHPGDIVLAGPPTGDDLHVGAILIVGDPPAGYTHRVIEVRGTGDERRAKLRGDANAVADPHWARQSDVTGVPVATLGGAAAVAARAVLQRPGTLVVAGALIACTTLLLVTRRRPEAV